MVPFEGRSLKLVHLATRSSGSFCHGSGKAASCQTAEDEAKAYPEWVDLGMSELKAVVEMPWEVVNDGLDDAAEPVAPDKSAEKIHDSVAAVWREWWRQHLGSRV